MSSDKKRRKPWDDEDTMDFMDSRLSRQDTDADTDDAVENEAQQSTEFLEEAHEALSKLFNKTNKRGKQLRGVRRRDAWQ